MFLDRGATAARLAGETHRSPAATAATGICLGRRHVLVLILVRPWPASMSVHHCKPDFAGQGWLTSSRIAPMFTLKLASDRDQVSSPCRPKSGCNGGPTGWRAKAGHKIRTRTHAAAEGNPVAGRVLRAIDAFRLPIEPLSRLIEEHQFDLYNDPMPTLAALEGYVTDTSSALFALAARVAGPASTEVEHLARHAGLAQGFMGVIAGLPRDASRRQLFLPRQLLERPWRGRGRGVSARRRRGRARR